MLNPDLITLDAVELEWKEDCVIDKLLLDDSSLKTPCLHSKYLEYLNRFKKQLRFLKAKKKSFPVTKRRTNLEYQEIEELIASQEDGISSCEEILRAINQRQWTIKGIIDYRKFLHGVDPL